jgi:restriction endonuclease S subunit
VSFSVSKAVNPPMVFLALLSELGDRFDPEMVLFRRKVHEFKYPVRKLRSFFRESPQYGAGERGLGRESSDQARYIRITDIDEYGVLNDELGATAANIEARYVLEEDDLLIARSGNTVGKSYLHKISHAPYPCFFAGYLIRFRFRRDELLPDYVFALTQLPYYKQWVQAVQRAAGQPNINAQEYSNFDTPVPPLPIQREVISLLHDAYDAKRKQDGEARNRLQAVGDLLLDELGIPRKPEPPNTIESRIFGRAFSEVTGRRLDPIANQEKRRRLEEAIHASHYPVSDLRKLIGVTKIIVDEIEPGQSYIGLENIDGESGEFIATAEKESIGTAIRFQPGQILFPKLRPYLNKTHLATFSGICSTEFHVFTPQGVAGDYLNAVLRSRAIVGVTSLLMTGNTLPRLQMSDIEQLPIPVPPLDVQKKLSAKITFLHAEARILREQARAGLEKAKREIETLIIGNKSGA